MKKSEFSKSVYFDETDKIWVASAIHTPTGRKTVLSVHAHTEEKALKRLAAVVEEHIAEVAAKPAPKTGNIHIRLGADLKAKLSEYIKSHRLKQNAFLEHLIQEAIAA